MSEKARHLLIVEDEESLRSAVAERLGDEGFLVDQAGTGEEALQRLEEFAYDGLITDLRLPGMNGSGVLEQALGRYPDLVAIVITGFGTVKDAVDAIRRGAADFVTKPFQFDELLHVLRTSFERKQLTVENAWLRSQLDARYSFRGLVGSSVAIRDLLTLLETVAPTNSTILITGETGTGKELIARAIHHNSTRRGQRFVALSCSAIPETLLEAELFGHVRGAFTGAIANRPGRFEQAHGGTIFLDEIGTMSPSVQARLLRVLQEREFERIGDTHPTKVDVRVVAATNADLEQMVRDCTFREDLYYRLNVIPITLPPLRERREDIPLLVQHFLDRFGREAVPPRNGLTLSQEAMRSLMAYAWPGNVRQLENVVERAIALSPGRMQIEAAALPAEVRQTATMAPSSASLPDEGLDFEAAIAEAERDLIRTALLRTGGNRRQAADLLRLKRTTLVEKMKRLSMIESTPPRPGRGPAPRDARIRSES
jgi:DNA-binding NtrC family response regulator